MSSLIGDSPSGGERQLTKSSPIPRDRQPSVQAFLYLS